MYDSWNKAQTYISKRGTILTINSEQLQHSTCEKLL